MQLSDFDGAQCGFESARLLATDKPEYEDIILQVETMLEVINIKGSSKMSAITTKPDTSSVQSLVNSSPITPIAKEHS